MISIKIKMHQEQLESYACFLGNSWKFFLSQYVKKNELHNYLITLKL